MKVGRRLVPAILALALIVVPLTALLWRRAVHHTRTALALDNERLGGGYVRPDP